MTWKMSDKIRQWGITWRDFTPTNPAVSLGINGDLGSIVMMSLGMTLLALTSTTNDKWTDALAAFLVVHPIWLGEGEDEYIAVVLNTKFCHMVLCIGAQDKGLQFSNGFTDDNEDVIDSYTTVEAAMDYVNKERLEATSKPNKCAKTKKSNVEVGAHETGDKTVVTRDPLRPKRKSISGEGKQKASRGKKSD